MNDPWNWIGVILFISVLIPIVVYLSCKLGSYGICVGRQKFRDNLVAKRKPTDGEVERFKS